MNVQSNTVKERIHMSTKFKEQQAKKDIEIILADHDLELSPDELEDLMGDLLPVVNDIFWLGYEHGKFVERELMKDIEDIEEDDEFAIMEDIPDDFYFPSEPE